MKPDLLKAIVDAIKIGVLAKDSPLSILEFEAIHAATLQTVAVAKRNLAKQMVERAREDFRREVEELAASV